MKELEWWPNSWGQINPSWLGQPQCPVETGATSVDSKLMIKISPSWFLRWFSNLLICFISLGLLFLILEFALILFVPEPITWVDPQERYVNHSSLGYTLVPNQRAFTHSSTVVTNSYGLRDREFTLKPEPGRFRILCLGDSLTFGNGLDSSSTYPKQLEALLNSSGQQGYEVINAGVPGYDLWQEAAYLKQYGLQFSPNLVIIGFYANDIVPKPKAIYQTIDEVSGFMRKKGVEGLFSYETIHLFKKSRLLLLLRDRYQKLMSGISPPPEYLHQTALLTGRVDRFVEDGWKEVEASLIEMTQLARQHNFALLIVIFPMPEQVIRIYPHAHYPAKLKEIAESNHIPYIDLMPLFLERFHGFGSLFIDWDGHPNAQAYKIAAEAIYHILFENNMVGSLIITKKLSLTSFQALYCSPLLTCRPSTKRPAVFVYGDAGPVAGHVADARAYMASIGPPDLPILINEFTPQS